MSSFCQGSKAALAEEGIRRGVDYIKPWERMKRPLEPSNWGLRGILVIYTAEPRVFQMKKYRPTRSGSHWPEEQMQLYWQLMFPNAFFTLSSVFLGKLQFPLDKTLVPHVYVCFWHLNLKIITERGGNVSDRKGNVGIKGKTKNMLGARILLQWHRSFG